MAEKCTRQLPPVRVPESLALWVDAYDKAEVAK